MSGKINMTKYRTHTSTGDALQNAMDLTPLKDFTFMHICPICNKKRGNINISHVTCSNIMQQQYLEENNATKD